MAVLGLHQHRKFSHSLGSDNNYSTYSNSRSNGYAADGPRPGGSWASAPDFTPRGGAPPARAGWDTKPSFNTNAYGNPGAGAGSVPSNRGAGDGQWRDGKHIPGPPNPRRER